MTLDPGNWQYKVCEDIPSGSMEMVRQTTVGYSKTSIFRTFGPYVFGTLGNEANIIIYHMHQPFVAFSLTPKYMTLNSPPMPFYVQFSLLRTAFQRLGYILLVKQLSLLIEYFCMTSPAKLCGGGEWNCDPQNIAPSWRDCGSFVDEKLRALHRRNLLLYYVISRDMRKRTV